MRYPREESNFSILPLVRRCPTWLLEDQQCREREWGSCAHRRSDEGAAEWSHARGTGL